MKLWKYGLDHLGTPYVWGGNDVTSGVDCSGFVCHMLREKGVIKDKDYSAAMLFDKLRTNFTHPKEDSILFFGRDFQTITHVAVAIDETFLIEAGGGDRSSIEKGCVRINRIKNRSDLLCSMEII